jgi:hypothetical protein
MSYQSFKVLVLVGKTTWFCKTRRFLVVVNMFITLLGLKS